MISLAINFSLIGGNGDCQSRVIRPPEGHVAGGEQGVFYEDLGKPERESGLDTALGFGNSHSCFGHSLSDAWLYINQMKKKGFGMRLLKTLLALMLTVFSLAGARR